MLKPIQGLPLILLAALGGCMSMAPRYKTPPRPTPSQWPEGPAYAPSGAPAKPAADVAWQDFYVDAKLRKVLTLALAHNPDLRIAALNTEKVRGAYRIQRAELLPSINAAAAGTRQRVPASVSSTGKDLIAEQDSVTVGVTAWELDFFGRVRSLKNQALEQYLATEQAQASARISLLAEVSNLYLTLAADRDALRLAKETFASQEATHTLTQRRFQAGIASELDARRVEVSMETARVDVASATRLVALDENALTFLVGAPVPADCQPAGLEGVAPLQDFTPGLPSDVLMARPDIRMAENQLRAANANIGAARAAFFPRISLTTGIGTMGSELSGLFKSGSDTWSFSPQVVLPLFNTGATKAGLDVAKADRDIRLAQYEKAVQAGFREVADTLAQRGTLGEQLAAQESLTRALERTFQLAKARYEAGADGYLGVLDAQRSLFGAQQGLIALRRARAANLVTLYKVLGGGLREKAAGTGSH
ncbi:efflux transporter outer membrane subunit [Mesoterricola silvestris]|uniref:AdeC/adeK/oprM family multidrug efflux complex outer membrane factor n=1 Tax=Mesoterricola silvestris TaxID=2927979 RepID=A0AA48GPL7_9BACT|nr:efflux transporter outer membrane subunit [Mesoterricola silvestris]BDU71672.1 adeC/adeK/oprM family multidrug efflux complex outer membrane factor [Mesoterricola silvestris]